MSERHHLWQGEWIDDEQVTARLAGLPGLVSSVLAEPLGVDVVVAACDRLAHQLADTGHPVRCRLSACLIEAGTAPEAAATAFDVLVHFLGRESLERKLRSELGSVRPDRLVRAEPRETNFETWAPVGMIAHIAPGNAPTVGALTVVEGLLAGNVNVVKVPGHDSLFTHELLAALAACDPTGLIEQYVVVLRFSSGNTRWLQLMCQAADAVAAWGGESAVAGVAEHVPAGCRLVEWGHKISFSYLTEASWNDPRTLKALAEDVCRAEQQACSSPQVIYLDTRCDDEVFTFAECFAKVLAAVSAKTAPAELGVAERAEITNTEIVAELEEQLGLTCILRADDGSWRVIADTRCELRASPLFRSVWIKPLPRARITSVLRPMRRYLQTVGLAADRTDTAVLSRAFFTAGALRVTAVGKQLDSYDGEPHDGVYALQRYSRRVSVHGDERFTTDGCLDDLAGPGAVLPPPTGPLTSKTAALAQLPTVRPEHTQLYVRSGGTTGGPSTWSYTWSDYDFQMRGAGEGLLAAGFDPRSDRAANLFTAGQMYGSFTSFFDILERLSATQIPYGLHDDFRSVAEALVKYRVDTLFSMPSYICQLFAAEGDVLREYGGIKKIFYGGAHLSGAQREVLRNEFGVEVIRSAVYGSNDLGPMGYQCTHATGSVHHLHTSLHTLEILDRKADRPVDEGAPGRLVFTSTARLGQRMQRYETGDLGRWMPGTCACGRKTPRFELLGRYGDVVRLDAFFISYRELARIADEQAGYAGELQMVLTGGETVEGMMIKLDERYTADPAAMRQLFLEHYPELRRVVETRRSATLDVQTVDISEFERISTSGKLREVIDRRRPGTDS